MIIKENEIEIRSLGDSGLVVQLDKEVNSTVHHKIINLIAFMEADPFPGFIEAIPGYNNITVFYDPVTVLLHHDQTMNKTAFKIVSTYMIDCMKQIKKDLSTEKRIIDIPVLYGEKFGPDLEYVAKYNDITPDKVIELHAEKDYLVYMIGFAPGFPYLANINKRISTPRKEKPRQNIPAGSVGIAGEQTGMYSLESPGGWQIIGQTPIDLFTPKSSPPTLLQSGDKIRFIPITEDEYFAYKENKQ